LQDKSNHPFCYFFCLFINKQKKLETSIWEN
jgi:hypothetical protein